MAAEVFNKLRLHLDFPFSEMFFSQTDSYTSRLLNDVTIVGRCIIIKTPLDGSAEVSYDRDNDVCTDVFVATILTRVLGQ